MTANIEQSRLSDDGHAWRRWGPYLSERAWGTVREDYSARWRRVGVPAPRSRPLPCLPLERGRARRAVRRPAAAVLRVVVLERRRSDPEGADLRSDRQRGQPRRGRQRAVVVPRLDPDPLLDALGLLVPAAASSPTSACSARTVPAAGRIPSSSCSTPASSTTTGTGTSPSTTPRHHPTTCACACGSATPAPTKRRSHVAAHDVVPQHLVVGSRRSQAGHRRQGRHTGGRAPRARPHGARG